MKQFILLILVFLISILYINAQNYQTVRSGRIAFFNNDQGRIKCIRIDSVGFDKDSVLFPMHNIQQLDYNCFTPKGNSWMGKKVIIKNNGVNLFFNNNNDTIRINTRAKVGESWTLFEIKDSIKIIAEVKSAEIQAVLNQPDSVKTIGFKVYVKNELVNHHYLSEKTLMISKNDGFVRMMNFNVFPKMPNASSFEILEPFDLVGLTNPERGVQNLTWFKVHDFQPGDVLHVLTKEWDWTNNRGYYYTWKTSWEFLERKDSKDSVYYRIERKESLEKIVEKWDNISYAFTHDTISEVYKPDSLFDKLPDEPIVINNGADTYGMINDGTFINKSKTGLVIRQFPDENCWYFLFWDGGGPGYYLKGLGGPYYGNNEINRGYEKSVVYYKKGDTTWGIPLVITSVNKFKTEDNVMTYPNPAANFVIIENRSGKAEKYIVSLIDLQGREVIKKEIVISNSYKVDISFLKEGAYLLKLQNQDTMFSKEIIRRL